MSLRVESALIEKCNRYWNQLSEYRTRRATRIAMAQGDQWIGTVTVREQDENGNICEKVISEKQHLANQGLEPMVINKMIGAMRIIVGHLRANHKDIEIIAKHEDAEPFVEAMTRRMEDARDINAITEKIVAMADEMCYWGIYAQKITYGEHPQLLGEGATKQDVVVENVDPTRLFFNGDLSDWITLRDLDTIGSVYDTPIESLLTSLCRKKDMSYDTQLEENVLQVYGIKPDWSKKTLASSIMPTRDIGTFRSKRNSFAKLWSEDGNRVRVIEVWQKEYPLRWVVEDPASGADGQYSINMNDTDTLNAVKEENQRRQEENLNLQYTNGQNIALGKTMGYTDDELRQIAENMPKPIPLIKISPTPVRAVVWKGYLLSALGHVLWEGESPYWHGEHPYALSFYKAVDGVFQGYLDELHEIQRAYNRMFTIMDATVRSGMYGVKLIPEDAVPDQYKDNQSEWASSLQRVGAVIIYKPSTVSNAVPQVITENSVNAGILTALGFLNNEFDTVSGFSNAMRGAEAKSGTTAAQYNQQIIQANTMLLDFLERLFSGRRTTHRKMLALCQQYQKDPIYMGKDPVTGTARTDPYVTPDAIRTLHMDVAIADVAATPASRAAHDETLLNLTAAGILPAEVFLEMWNHPKAPVVRSIIHRLKMEQAPMLQAMTMANEQDAAVNNMKQQKNPYTNV